MYLLRLMLVGVWLGLLWVLFYFFDHYIQSSVQQLALVHFHRPLPYHTYTIPVQEGDDHPPQPSRSGPQEPSAFQFRPSRTLSLPVPAAPISSDHILALF